MTCSTFFWILIQSIAGHLLYADDIQVYTQTTIDELNEGIRYLSIIGRAVAAWAVDNALSLNVRKTKAIIFGSNQNSKHTTGYAFVWH